ncbi:MAG: penicillin-binding transpeptidase domain-containing protein, partial [Oscillospiraceae bacterium]|nr:penicillin-binding transpeptidase domain-containing protein [Oscillospiraceae bacterium]
MAKRKFFLRYFALLAVFVAAVFWYGGTLLNMQIARADEFRRQITYTSTKLYVVPAVRGEIFDRNGVPLVTNRNVYDIIIDGIKMPKRDYVGILIDVVEKINFYNGELAASSLPVMAIATGGDWVGASYAYSMMTQAERLRFDRFLTKNKLNANTSAEELVAFLTAKYSLDEYMPPEQRDQGQFLAMLGVCYEIDRQDVLAGSNTYTICADINKVLMAIIKENAHNYPGVEVRLGYERVYNIPSSAPHILGTIGKITEETWEKYKNLGYSMDAIVGRSGVEAAFEQYLRGTDGILERTFDQDGILVGESYIKEPVAGKDVYLTLDIKLQQVAEYSLEKTIDRIHDLSKAYPDPKLNGGDANAGATAVIDPDTGQVLAIATYPSYDITVFKDAEKYGELSEDPNKPFYNRATQGIYAPGSVFKIVTSVAALCHGDLGVNEYIYDQGKFTKFTGYQPVCWYYPYSHESINVAQAIRDSCNYFFYVVGDRMGIDPLAECAKHLGMGEYTGIEIAEQRGILASPEFVESRGGVWTGGQTIAAAIGQSFNAFTPLQMANMLGSVLNGGNRYKATLLLCVKEYGSDEIYYAPEPELADSIDIPEAYLNAVKS